AEQVFAAALEPPESFEAVGVEEAGLLEVEDEVDDLLVVDPVVGELADDGRRVAHQVAVEGHHADVVVVFTLDRHGGVRVTTLPAGSPGGRVGGGPATGGRRAGRGTSAGRCGGTPRRARDRTGCPSTGGSRRGRLQVAGRG